MNTIAAIAPGGATAGVATPAATLEALQWSSGAPIAGITNDYFGASAITYSSDGALFAASTNQGLKTWRVSDGALLQTISALANGIVAGISKDGSVAAVGMWLNDTGTLLISRPAGVLTLSAGSGAYATGTVPAGFSGLVVSPDGSLVIAAYEQPSGSGTEPKGYTLTAWKTGDGSVAWTQAEGRGLNAPGARLAISNDGAHVAVGVFNGGAGLGGQILNTADGSTVSSIYAQPYAFSPDGLGVLAASSISLALYRVSDGTVVQGYAAGPTNTKLLAAAFSDNNYDILSIVYDPSLPSGTQADPPLLRLANDGTVVGQIARVSATSALFQMQLSPDGAWVATENAGGPLLLWNVSSQSVAMTLSASSYAAPMLFSPDGHQLAFVANASNTVTLQPVPGSPSTVVTIPVNTSALAYSPAGDLLAVGNPSDYSIGLWNPTPPAGGNTGKLVRTTVANINTKHTNTVSSLAFSPDGQLIASSSYDGTIKLWNVSDGTLVRTITGWGSIAFSPDGSYLFSDGQTLGKSSMGLTVWDPATGSLVHSFSSQRAFGSGAPVFPPGQGTFLDAEQIGGPIDTMRLDDWSFASSVPLSTGTAGLSLSADGRTLASSSYDDAVTRLWCWR